MTSETIHAPWTAEQVESLNRYQTSGLMHQFTCGGECGESWATQRPTLIATEAGWTCPGCDYTQDWAHDFMADNAFLDELEKMFKW